MNFNGLQSIPSVVGLISTFLLSIIFLSYAVIRATDLNRDNNSSINQATIMNKFKEDVDLDLTKIGFKIAFGLIDVHNSQNIKVDPEYV